ncbi:response regulator [Gracilimonas sediminicola]|uniref:Response regulator n=1 Tax=Gracilimonas sediminicola TaxID=2952158 RepID=A0A9X2L3M9_9BACT|nr:response regulator [Gracilimonas sediminicola]MCP9291635.1 response regulator [Gracilimonas sediminicola]
MKIIKLFWIDDMAPWAKSAQDNLIIVANKYKINLKVIPALNGEDMDITWKAENYDFDCIVMDYHMEPYNGDKYIKEIREEEHLEHIPIIFYSQDNSTDLDELVEGLPNIITVFRPNLEDKIKEMFF